MSQEAGSHGAVVRTAPYPPDPSCREMEAAVPPWSELVRLGHDADSGERKSDRERRGRREPEISAAGKIPKGARTNVQDFSKDVPEIEFPLHPNAAKDAGQKGRHSIEDLITYMVSGLEEARSRDGGLDPRHIVAQLSEGVGRRGHSPDRSNRDRGFDDVHEGLRTLRNVRLADAGGKHLLSIGPAKNARAIAVHGRSEGPSYARSTAVAAPNPERVPPGIKLDLHRATPSIDMPGSGTSVHLRKRRAVLTFDIPRLGLSYCLQLSSSRLGAHTSAAAGHPRLGVGLATCALIAAGVLLQALPGLRMRLPETQRTLVASPTKSIAQKPELRLTPPLFSMMSRPLLEEKAPVDEPPQITEPAQERVATKSTTNIRLRPEQGAQVIRVVPGRLILTVFARREDWVEVGGTQAWGWIHSSLVFPVASST
jgi:hypothetical protein